MKFRPLHDRVVVRRHGAVVAGKILEKAAYGFGYNAHSGEYGDLASQRRHRPDQGCS